MEIKIVDTNLENYPIPPWSSRKRWLKDIKDNPWRVKVIIRDNYRCVDCGVGNEQLVVHHIDGSTRKGNNDLKNLSTLCKKCHARRHGQTNKSLRDEVRSYYEMSGGKVLHGSLTLLAERHGVTRERIRQLAEQMGFTSARKTMKKLRMKNCEYCGKEFEAVPKTKKCCSRECYKRNFKKKYWTTKPCKNCNKKIEFRKQLIKIGREPTYCSKRCQGKWLSKHYGFRFRAEATKESNRKRAYSPESREELKVILPKRFTTKTFKKTFGYSGTGAQVRINKLLGKGVIAMVGEGKHNTRIYSVTSGE